MKKWRGKRNDSTTVVTNDTDGGGNDNGEVINETEDDMDDTPMHIPIDEGKLTKMSREELKEGATDERIAVVWQQERIV